MQPTGLVARFVQLWARLFGNPKIPVHARLKTKLPITLAEPLVVPIKGQFTIDLEDSVQVDGLIPVETNIPIDTVVETEVLKFGRVKIPIKALIPISVTVPVSARVKVRIKGLTVDLDKSLTIPLPTLSVPLDATITTEVTFCETAVPERRT